MSAPLAALTTNIGATLGVDVSNDESHERQINYKVKVNSFTGSRLVKMARILKLVSRKYKAVYFGRSAGEREAGTLNDYKNDRRRTRRLKSVRKQYWMG